MTRVRAWFMYSLYMLLHYLSQLAQVIDAGLLKASRAVLRKANAL